MDFIQVMTTIDSRKKAEAIQEKLLEVRLAACVQIIGPIKSRYWWQGKLEETREWICLAKARADDYPQIEKTIKKGHSYQVPEVLALPVVKGNPDYLNWIAEETKRK